MRKLIACLFTTIITLMSVVSTTQTELLSENKIVVSFSEQQPKIVDASRPSHKYLEKIFIQDQDYPECDVEQQWCFDQNISAEENIFNYLTKELKIPPVAACGILGNIAYETGWTFDPETGSPSRCYGLIQWLGGRLSKLKTWCADNNRDYNTIEGQLDFLYWEMVYDDPYNTYNYLTNCDDSENGAYDAGWYFCYWFERPNNKNAQSDYRGNEAAKYYEMFAED